MYDLWVTGGRGPLRAGRVDRRGPGLSRGIFVRQATIKAILDTNVVTSGIFSEGRAVLDSESLAGTARAPGDITASTVRDGRISASLRGDDQETAARRSGFDPRTHRASLGDGRTDARPKSRLQESDDDKFPEAAVAAKADSVISGDPALLNIKNYRANPDSSDRPGS